MSRVSSRRLKTTEIDYASNIGRRCSAGEGVSDLSFLCDVLPTGIQRVKEVVRQAAVAQCGSEITRMGGVTDQAFDVRKPLPVNNRCSITDEDADNPAAVDEWLHYPRTHKTRRTRHQYAAVRSALVAVY